MLDHVENSDVGMLLRSCAQPLNHLHHAGEETPYTLAPRWGISARHWDRGDGGSSSLLAPFYAAPCGRIKVTRPVA